MGKARADPNYCLQPGLGFCLFKGDSEGQFWQLGMMPLEQAFSRALGPGNPAQDGSDSRLLGWSPSLRLSLPCKKANLWQTS